MYILPPNLKACLRACRRGAKRAFVPALEIVMFGNCKIKILQMNVKIGTKNQKCFENLKSAPWFRLIDFILAITLYLFIWHSHCTRASFTVLVWCSDELAVHSCPLVRLRTHVGKLASAWFYCCSLLCNNNMATNLQRFTSRYDSWCVFSYVAVDLRDLWQVMQRDSECW